jgi:hypothetical protein
MKANLIIKQILDPNTLGLPAKLFEYTVIDCFKAIGT